MENFPNNFPITLYWGCQKEVGKRNSKTVSTITLYWGCQKNIQDIRGHTTDSAITLYWGCQKKLLPAIVSCVYDLLPSTGVVKNEKVYSVACYIPITLYWGCQIQYLSSL